VREAKEQAYLKISELFLLLLKQFQFLRIPFYFNIFIKIYIGYSYSEQQKKKNKDIARTLVDGLKLFWGKELIIKL
jgi:hypothetical protein